MTGVQTCALPIFFDGSVRGDELQWKVTLKQMKMTLTFTASVDQDTMTGKVKAGMFGRFNVRGARELEPSEA